MEGADVGVPIAETEPTAERDAEDVAVGEGLEDRVEEADELDDSVGRLEILG